LASANCIAATAVIGLETEVKRKTVRRVTGTLFSLSARPNACTRTTPPLFTTATAIPGM
jgi:hypothetical protein